MKKTAGNGRGLGSTMAMGCPSPYRSPREGPSERLLWAWHRQNCSHLLTKCRQRIMEGKSIKHIRIQSGLIETMGYEPQHALLEIRLSDDGKVWQYRDVPDAGLP